MNSPANNVTIDANTGLIESLTKNPLSSFPSSKMITVDAMKAALTAKQFNNNPIALSIKDGVILDNSKDMATFVDCLDVAITESLQGFDLEKCQKITSITYDTYRYLVACRKHTTAPINKIDANYIVQEKKLYALIEKMKKHETTLLSSLYASRAKVLTSYVESQIEAAGYNISIKSFSADIEKKSKTKCLTATDKPNKASRDFFDELLGVLIAPIKEEEERAAKAAELETKKSTQRGFLNKILSSTEGVDGLELMLSGVSEDYPDIIDEANDRINSQITLIKRAKALADKKLEEQKAELLKATQVQAPVQQAPVQQAPVQQAPVQQAPVQAAPVQAAPVQAAPVQAAPVQQAPETEMTQEDRVNAVRAHMLRVRKFSLGSAGDLSLEGVDPQLKKAYEWIDRQIINVAKAAIATLEGDKSE